MFLHYETIEEDGREIIAVDVQRGTDRPYYLIKKGMQPAGVYDQTGVFCCSRHGRGNSPHD